MSVDDFPNQDGVESYRRAMLDLAPAKKAGIDKMLGQSAERAAAQGFSKAIVTEGLYAYPAQNGSIPALIDWAESQADEIRALRDEVNALREQALRGPFA